MQSNRIARSGELDITVNSDISDLEKTLLQVKSLRYQMYNKYLSEKLIHERKLRKLENENLVLSQKFTERGSGISSNSLASKPPLQERSVNEMRSSALTAEKSIQTCNFHEPNVSMTSLCDSKRSLGDTYRNPLDSDREAKNYYDERLFNIVEQLEFLAQTDNIL